MNTKKTFFFSKIKDMTNPLNKTLESLKDIIGTGSIDEDSQTYKELSAIINLFLNVIKANGCINESEIEEVSDFFLRNYGKQAVILFRTLAAEEIHSSLKESCEILEKLSFDQKYSLLESLTEIAYADDDYSSAEIDVLKLIAKHLQLPNEIFEEINQKLQANYQKRQAILNSGTGIIAAFVIIAIFILTATFLKSVFLGLILAYLFLPVQQWYQKTFFTNVVIRGIGRIINFLFLPFSKLTNFAKGIYKSKTVTDADIIGKKEQTQEEILLSKQQNKACHATLFSFLLGIALSIFTLISLLSSYVKEAKIFLEKQNITIKSNVQPQKISQKKSNKPLKIKQPSENSNKTSHLNIYEIIKSKAEKILPAIKSLPYFEQAIETSKIYLSDKNKQSQLISWAVTKSKGFFSAATGFLGTIASFLLEFMLTLFFFSYFLAKMAVHKSSSTTINTGNYLVNGIFNSSWMPHTNKETRDSATEILNTIFDKLKIWVRGYFSIIFIESVIYITIFLILGIPYAVILGMIAGTTVLLPFLGPLASACLTIIVSLALGQLDLTLLLLICSTYLVMNAVIEQFFLYPAFVGEALGLTLLETIIVVLLGALFAGLTGVIFAVPVASILKYLIPRIYSCWIPEKDKSKQVVLS